MKLTDDDTWLCVAVIVVLALIVALLAMSGVLCGCGGEQP